MKIKDGYVLREVAGNWIVLPLASETVNFSGMLTLNNSGVVLWRLLEQGASKDRLVKALTDEYEVSLEQAASDVDSFINKLINTGCVEE
ncbi:MAG: PqqD family protein [Ruminococcaceae bacterium]|nr:PqqD family protein [Oscillospiraceae bacterium]